MAITEERPTAGECPHTTSLQRIDKRPSYSPGTRSFVYADNLAGISQSTDVLHLTSALVGLSEYYSTNQLRTNPTKTQFNLFHLRNRGCGKQLNISWNGVNLTHCNLSVYIGVTLDRTLSYKAHVIANLSSQLCILQAAHLWANRGMVERGVESTTGDLSVYLCVGCFTFPGSDRPTTTKAASVRKQLGTKNSKSNEDRQAKNGGVK